jgi:hypothetical protein
MLLSPFAIPFPVRTLTRDETNDTEYKVLNPCRKDISRFVTTKIPKAMNAVVAMDLRLMESIISSSSFYSEAEEYLDTCCNVLAYIATLADDNGDTSLADDIREKFNNLLE